MIEIILAILVIACIIYIFKGDFTRKSVGVTVLESLPLSIFKKWGKENNSIKQEKIVEINNIETINDKNTVDIGNEVLSEVAITTINEESEIIDIKDNIEEIKIIEEPKTMDLVQEIKEEVENEVNNYSENIFDTVMDESKEIIENKEINEEVKENSKEINSEINNINEVFNEKSEELVFWTQKGKTYHAKSSCRTLARSKVINSGTVYESGKDFKCEHCK